MNLWQENRSKLSFTNRIITKYSLERFLSICGEKMSKGLLKFCKLISILILGQIIVSNLTNVHEQIYIYIYIYIYTRFQKGFHIERYIDRYILLLSCTCARAHFSFSIVQLVKKLGSTINFFLRRVLCSNLKRTCRLSFFRKSIRPAIQICNGELYDRFWE